MLSISQLTVAAYMTDGAVVCRECGENAKLPTGAALIQYTLESDFPEGLSCDSCGKELVEPEEQEDE